MKSEQEANKQVVRDFLTALGRGDAEAMAPILSPDVQAIATGTSFMSGTRDRNTILSTLGTLSSITEDGIDFALLSMTAEQDRVSAEAQGRSTLVNGTPYNNEYHFLFTLRGGKIVRIREYFCTKLTEDAFGPLLAGQQS
ncbi:MAG TPA: nuclear transport factor 2 family protein [Sphingomonas sp.]|nr:nuclear transport factor 2 family protein [Sphingomonas sp.]